MQETLELAICSNCSNCCEVVSPSSGSAAVREDTESVLLDLPCPRCGEAAMRVSESGVWD